MNIEKFRGADKNELLKQWNTIIDPATDPQTKGKEFEYFICRAFELEGAKVEYPFTVKVHDKISEQLDGLISVDGIHCLIECKNQQENVDFEPFSKLRSRLQRRPSSAIGAIFTTASFTSPAIILNQFLHPQTILMWEKEEISQCLEKNFFVEGLKIKYEHCIKNGLTNYNLLAELLIR
jgi:hypothetical protein